MEKKSGCSLNIKMGIHFYYIFSTHCQRKKERRFIIFTFHIADTSPQIYDLIGLFCKTCCDFFFPTESNYYLLSKSSVRSVNASLQLLCLRVMLHCLFLMTHYFKSKVHADKMFISAFLQVDKKD